MKRLFALFSLLAFCLLCAPGVLAAPTQEVRYLDETGTEKNCGEAISVTADVTAWTDADETSGWYVVYSSATIFQRVTVTGDVHLILADNASLTVKSGIEVTEGNALTIYAQSTGETMGRLTANAANGNAAGIGSGYRNSGGSVTINGGSVKATGGGSGAGIGGGFNGNGGTVTINGGSVKASGGNYGAGIGGGFGSSGGSVTINGGSVKATGGGSGAGIGGGSQGSGGIVTINGGSVKATGGDSGAGIGGGSLGNGGSVTINGGSVTATGGSYAGIGSGAGIGGGFLGSGAGTLTIGPAADGKMLTVTAGADKDNASPVPGSAFTEQENIMDKVSGQAWFRSEEAERKAPAPSGVTLEPTELSLRVGDSSTLTATVAPADASDKNVTWKNDSESIAAVTENDDGTVTVKALAPGKATITAATSDGNRTASCTVTVTQAVTAITLEPTELSLFAGNSTTLKATVAPEDAANKALSWASDKPDIADVTVNADGTVTVNAKAPGQANITATAADGSGVTASCKVTVTRAVSAVTLDKAELSLFAGSSANLTAAVAPEDASSKALSWASDKPDIADVTVNADGTVTVNAKAPGLANITATAADGSGVTASCKVTVTRAVSAITLDKAELSLFTGDSTTLKAAVAPEDAANKALTWASDKPDIADVTVNADGSVTVNAKAPGQANITATAADGSGVKASCKVTVTARTYQLFANVSAINFGNVFPGYTQPGAQTFTVTNTGNQTLSGLTLSSPANFVAGNLSATTVEPGKTVTFTAQPKAGLGVGSYNETITLTGSNGTRLTVNVSFTVVQTPTSTPASTPEPPQILLHFNTMGGLPLGDVSFGQGAPVELWPYTPVRIGYLFQGWYKDQALTQPVTKIVLVDETTLYAKWAVDPAAQAAASGSGSGSGSSSGKGGSGKGSGSKATPAPSATPSPTPKATATPSPTPSPTPKATATPEATVSPTPDPETTGSSGFPVIPVAAGAGILALLAAGGIWFFRRR